MQARDGIFVDVQMRVDLLGKMRIQHTDNGFKTHVSQKHRDDANTYGEAKPSEKSEDETNDRPRHTYHFGHEALAAIFHQVLRIPEHSGAEMTLLRRSVSIQ